jgi:hypothetical protein
MNAASTASCSFTCVDGFAAQGCIAPTHRAHRKISLQYLLRVLVRDVSQLTTAITDRIDSVVSPPDDATAITGST